MLQQFEYNLSQIWDKINYKNLTNYAKWFWK